MSGRKRNWRVPKSYPAVIAAPCSDRLALCEAIEVWLENGLTWREIERSLLAGMVDNTEQMNGSG